MFEREKYERMRVLNKELKVHSTLNLDDIKRIHDC
jgi:hypothetical protein